MRTESYGFQIKPEESAECHQTLSSQVGSGQNDRCIEIHNTKVSVLLQV